MGLFKNMTTDTLEHAEDRVGGGVQAVATDVYAATVKNLYAGASESGAQNLTVILDVGGKEVRETVYITKRTGEHYYFDKEDKTKKLPLPGFSLMNDLCLLTTNEGLAEQRTEEKIVKIYNFTERKEIPTPAEVVVGALGQKVLVAISRVVQPVEKADDSGKRVAQYDDNGKLKTRTINEIKKVFHLDTRRTVNEILQDLPEAEFINAWLERYKGKDDDSAVKALSQGGAPSAGPGASGSGRPQAGGGEAAPKKKLFTN